MSEFDAEKDGATGKEILGMTAGGLAGIIVATGTVASLGIITSPIAVPIAVVAGTVGAIKGLEEPESVIGRIPEVGNAILKIGKAIFGS